MKPGILLFLIFAFITVSLTFGQKNNNKILITGVVVDVNQNPVPDAIMLIDGKKSTKSTSKEGVYKIKVKSSAVMIGIFTLPPEIIEEPINGRTNINFTLDTSTVNRNPSQSNAYGDEEVNIGFGTEKRKNLTTSVNKLDVRKERYASYNSIYDLL